MTESEATARIGDFVRSSLGKDDLAGSDDIFEVGGASSIFAMEIVLYIEQELGIELDEDDLERKRFETIDALKDMVASKIRVA